MNKINRSVNFYLTVLIAAVLTVAVIAAIFSGNSVKTLNPGSPEKTVQEYLQALTDGRNDLAANQLSKESGCTVQEIDRSYIWPSAQITLLKSEITGNSAIVQVSIERRTDTFMDSGMMNEQPTFRLVKEKSQWKISGVPWPLYDCGSVKK
jgi:hypothetical protein